MTFTTLTGPVSRIVHVSEGGGSIFRLLENDASKSVRVVAPGKVLSFVPSIGEPLSITGQYTHDREFGRQFVARAVVRCLPRGTQVVKLLSSNVRFAWMEARLIRRLWKALGQQLAAILGTGDLAPLVYQAKIPLSDAIRLVREWRNYVRYVEVSTYFAAQGFPHAAVTKAIEVWGNSTINTVSQNPYSLVPFGGWAAIDKVCTTYLNVGLGDEARLVAACISSVEEHIQRYRKLRVSVSFLRKSLARRLRDAPLAEEALRFTEARGLIRLAGEQKAFAQPIGISMLEDAFGRRARALGNTKNASFEEFGTASSSNRGLPLKHPGVCALNFPCASTVGVPKEIADQAMHIYPSASMRAAFSRASEKTALLSEVIKGTSENVKESFAFFVHGADALDLAIATRLLYALPEFCSVTLVPSGEVTGGADAFWHFLTTLPDVLQLSLRPDGGMPVNLKDTDDALSVPFQPAIAVAAPQAALQRTKVKRPHAVLEKALAIYREAADNDTALLLTLRKSKATQLNYALHEEHVELRKVLQLPVPELEIYGRKTATIDEKVVARADIPNKCIVAGALGTITAIFASNNERQSDISSGLAIAIVHFDTTGVVELSHADCCLLDFGYAVPFDLDRWAAIAHRVVVGEQSSEIDLKTFSSHMYRTTKSFSVIEAIPDEVLPGVTTTESQTSEKQ